ncbi:hypothetical protein HispidOSU_027957, partial [Sigmodon hispidus]
TEKLELANDDERYVQKAISTTSSGAKPVSGSLSRIRALHIDPSDFFRVYARLSQKVLWRKAAES